MEVENMRRSLLVFLLLGSSFSFAGPFKLDPAHSEVGFSVKHLVYANVKGRFNKFDGGFSYDDKTKTVSNIDVKVDTTSIDTNDKKRDDHLMSADFFDAKKNPTLTFKADKIAGVEPGKTFKVPGTLTMRGVSKPIALEVEFRGLTTDPWGNEKLIFGATSKIQRKDWGINWNKALDKGGMVVGEDVVINVEGEAGKAK
jgi:polyisoprenoid-binding protein YceI